MKKKDLELFYADFKKAPRLKKAFKKTQEVIDLVAYFETEAFKNKNPDDQVYYTDFEAYRSHQANNRQLSQVELMSTAVISHSLRAISTDSLDKFANLPFPIALLFTIWNFEIRNFHSLAKAKISIFMIKPEKLVILDNFVFDKDRLLYIKEGDIDSRRNRKDSGEFRYKTMSIWINPYTGLEFSPEAKDKLQRILRIQEMPKADWRAHSSDIKSAQGVSVLQAKLTDISIPLTKITLGFKADDQSTRQSPNDQTHVAETRLTL